MRRRLVGTIVAWGLVSAAAGAGCRSSGTDHVCADEVAVDVVASPETAPLLRDLAHRFNADDEARAVGPTCARVAVHTLAAHRAEALLAGDWEAAPGDLGPPTIWSPGASTWATLLDERRAAADRPPMAYETTPVARTPLVVALPRSRAEALGWPDQPVELARLVQLAHTDLAPTSRCGDLAPTGMRRVVNRWCDEGWGPLRIGKADPRLSTAGLEALIVGAYAGAGKSDRLTVADLRHSWVERFTGSVEAAVGRYGESPRRLLDDMYRADIEGRVAPGTTAVLVEEKAVIDYDRGDPAGRLAPGETGTRPGEPLVAVYPAEGTVYEDGPLVVLAARWSTEPAQAAARRFVAYVRSPEVQQRVADHGFRPADPGASVEGELFSPDAYGVEPAPDVPELAVPDAGVLDALQAGWRAQRRPARALLVVDVSGAPARQALTGALARLGGDDEVGLWTSATGAADPTRELVPVGRLDARGSRQRRSLADAIGGLRPGHGTALDATVEQAHAAMVDGADPDRLDAVVLLTDGHAEINGPAARRSLLAGLASRTETVQVPVFTIAYGSKADADSLQQVADATGGSSYDATDPSAIDQAVTEALSNL